MSDAAPIRSPRLRIESFASEHLTERYVGWLNDPVTMRYSENRFRRHTLESCREYAQSFAGSDHLLWAVIATDTALGHIGNLNAYVDQRHGVADVGILIGEPGAGGHGYATEAWLAVCDFLLRTREMRKVTAGTITENTSMLRLMARAGMRDDGRRVRQQVWEGREVDVVHAALFRDEWLRRYPDGPFGNPQDCA